MTAIPTRLQFAQASAIARRFARAAVDERRHDALIFCEATLAMIDAGLDAGVSRDFLYDAARGLYDEMSKLQAGMRRDLDDVGCLDEWQPIDVGDLEGLIERLA